MEDGDGSKELKCQLKVFLIIHGEPFAMATRDLDEVALIAEGPQSFESGLMSAVREIAQEMFCGDGDGH